MKLNRRVTAVVLFFTVIRAWTLQTQEYDNTIHVSCSGYNGSDTPECWEGGASLPCQTLNYALRGVVHSTLVVLSGVKCELNLEGNSTSFQGIDDLGIVGDDGEMDSVLINCSEGAGLAFINSSRITLKNVEFSGCGALHTITSRNFSDTSTFTFLESQIGLYFLFCQDINFSRVTVSHSSGTGMVMYATTGTNIFENCIFSFNEASTTKYSGGGGLYIEFPFCIPGDISCEKEQVSHVPVKYTDNADYKFYDCKFVNNTAEDTIISNTTFILPQRSQHLAIGRGGGLSFYFKGNATNNSVLLDSCQIAFNKAVWGGGLFVEFHDNATNNDITMINSSIESNSCNFDFQSSGGGIHLALLFHGNSFVKHTTISFHSCNFSGNEAYWGGGFSFKPGLETGTVYATNTLEFKNCTWRANSALIGAAFDCLPWHIHAGTNGSAAQPRFINCVFYNNTAGNYPNLTIGFSWPIGNGAVNIDNIPVTFEKSVIFERNQGTALTVGAASVQFGENTTVNFTNNTGRYGGAILLDGYAFIIVSPTTVVNFVSNQAKHAGGAIYAFSVSKHDFRQTSGHCIIRYSEIGVTPERWETLFYFKDNEASNLPNSIFTTSVQSCLWWYDGETNTTRQVFCWDKWTYEGSRCDEQVESMPAFFELSNEDRENSTYQMSALPGDRTALPITTMDDRRKDSSYRTVVIADVLPMKGVIGIDSSSLYIADNQIELYGEPDSLGVISLETQYPRDIHVDFIVKLKSCPPGFVTSGENNTICKCGGNFGGFGYITCFGSSLESALIRGAWIGYYEYRGERHLVAAICPYCARFSELMDPGEGYVNLPDDPQDLDTKLCGLINRTGVLCGKCIETHGPAFNSRIPECVPCSKDSVTYNWVIYVLMVILPMTVFFFIVVLLNISITTGPANAFVLFAQVITTVFCPDSQNTIPLTSITSTVPTLQALYIIPYDIWNLNFFQPVLPKICLSADISTIQLMAIWYITASYPILLIGTFSMVLWLYNRNVKPVMFLCRPVHKCFYNLRRRWNLQRSLIDAFGTFLLLSYSKFILISVLILSQTQLYDHEGKTVGPGVLYFNGEITLYSKEYIPFFLAAVLVLTVIAILPPLILVLPSLFKVLERIGIKCFGRWHPGQKLRYFLNIFHGCYKDGTEPKTHDCRWFAGIYFCIRLAIYSTYPLSSNWFLRYVSLQTICTLVIFMFVLFRPYRVDWYNKLDAFIFTILALVNSLTMYNYWLLTSDRRLSTASFTIQYILIFIPLVYIIVYGSYIFWVTYQVYLQSIYHKLTKVLHCFDKKDASDEVSLSEEWETDSTNVMTFSEIVAASGRDREPNTYKPPASKRYLFHQDGFHSRSGKERVSPIQSVSRSEGYGSSNSQENSSFVHVHLDD